MQTHWELGLKVKCITLVRLGKGALVAVTLALWCEEALEAVTSLRGIRPQLDVLLDLLTGTSTVALIAWVCTERIIRTQERRVAALTSVVVAASEMAGIHMDGPRGSGPHRRLRRVGDGEQAG